MLQEDIQLYKDLVSYCNEHASEIETKFLRELSFTPFNEDCYKTMFYENRHASAPPVVKDLKEKINGLKEAYAAAAKYYLNPRNKYKKGLDIQLGQWYEKALCMFLSTKGFVVKKKGFPFPDLEVSTPKGEILSYFELKYIESPFLSANTKIKNTYPYEGKRFDYEASLTLDTGKKMCSQREKMQELEEEGFPVHFLWWFDSFHIKGIFAMSAHDVYDFYDHVGDLHERKTREGDAESHQEIGKIYPPLLEMTTFGEYVDLLDSLRTGVLQRINTDY